MDACVLNVSLTCRAPQRIAENWRVHVLALREIVLENSCTVKHRDLDVICVYSMQD